MANERTLSATYSSTLNVQYRNQSTNLSNTIVKDDIRNVSGQFQLTNGSEPGEVDLQYKTILTVPAGGVTLDLDGGLLNVWEDVLDFYHIKYVFFKNIELAGSGNIIEVSFTVMTFEQYAIGPQGYRILYEPDGLQLTGASSAGDRGTILIDPKDGVTTMQTEIIILGTSTFDNISSGL